MQEMIVEHLILKEKALCPGGDKMGYDSIWKPSIISNCPYTKEHPKLFE